MNFKAACIQLNSSDDMEKSLEQTVNMIKAAHHAGADFIATPENTACMPSLHNYQNYAKYGCDDHPVLITLRALAQELQIWLLIGSIAIRDENLNKVYNRSILLNSHGEIAAYYDKIHLFDANLPNGEKYLESKRVIAGNHMVSTNLPWCKLGFSICYDLRFPYLYRNLAKCGSAIISVPSAFTEETGKAHWHVLLRSRAIENGCFIIAPNQTGHHPGKRTTYGHSLIITPWGDIIAEAGVEEGFIIAIIDPQKVAQARSTIPSLNHDRSDTIIPFPIYITASS